MSDRPILRKFWRAYRLPLVAFSLLGLYFGFNAWQAQGHAWMPSARWHGALVTVLVVAGVGSLIHCYYRAVRRDLVDVRADMCAVGLELQDVRRQMVRLHSILVKDLERRSDVPTDRIVAVADRRLSESDRDREVRAPDAAMAQVLRLPSTETRDAVNRINSLINNTGLQ